MELAPLLHIHPGVTAVIGGGGKTTLLHTLGQELVRQGRVLLCTTTKIYPFADLPTAMTQAELQRLAFECRLLCAGTAVPGTGKLTAPDVPFSDLIQWFEYVLVEADGSAHRPMKAHAPHEPVIPPEAETVICVVGASGFGRPIEAAAHRPELYARLAGAAVDDALTPERAAEVLQKEGLHDLVYINQVESASAALAARCLASKLNTLAVAGSLVKGKYFTC